MALHLLIAIGSDPSPGLSWLASLLTYLAHGVIWGGAAALLVRSRALSSSMQGVLWLSALLGPIVTTSFATTVPSFGRAELAHELEVVSFASSAASDMTAVARAPALSNLVVLLGIAALLGSLRIVSSWLAFAWRLRARTPVTDPRLLLRLAELRRRTVLRHVTLTESAALDVPVVLGRSEICLPIESSSAASLAEVDAVLAHELAHLERRDGVVFPLVGLMQSILWLQPLNHLLAARFRRAAELACDDRAVELTGDPLSLARAIARVASRASRASHAVAIPTMARARPASVLVARVRRLVEGSGRASASKHQRCATTSLVLIAAATASLSVRAARPPQLQAAARNTREVAAASIANEQIAELMHREQQLQSELERSRLSAARGSDSVVQTLELQQQLRHVRESAAWVERSFVGESSH